MCLNRLVLSFFIFICVGTLSAQISLLPLKSTSIYPDPISHLKGESRYIVDPNAISLNVPFIYHYDAGRLEVFDTSGGQLNQIQLKSYLPTNRKRKKWEWQTVTGSGSLYPGEDRHVIMQLNGLLWTNDRGQSLHNGWLSKWPPHALFLDEKEDDLWFGYDNVNEVFGVLTNNHIVMPLVAIRNHESSRKYYKKLPYPSEFSYDLRKGMITHQDPLFVVYSNHPDSLTPCPSPKEENTEYRPDVLKPLFTFGTRGPWLDSLNELRIYNPFLHSYFVSHVPKTRTYYVTECMSPWIDLHSDTDGSHMGRFPKHDFQSDSLFFFTLEELLALHKTKLEAKIYGPDALFNLEYYHYGRSKVDLQLFADTTRQLLYRVIRRPDPKVSWEGVDVSDDKALGDVYMKSGTRFIQVYDLTQNGRFINEIPVPPLFGILEVDKNGDLWAISAIDSEAVTITRYRVEGWK